MQYTFVQTVLRSMWGGILNSNAVFLTDDYFLCSAQPSSKLHFREGNVRQLLHCDTVLAAQKFTGQPAIRLHTLQACHIC